MIAFVGKKINRTNDLLIAGIILAIGCFYVLTFRQTYILVDDSFLYLHHAKNIVLGISYKNTDYIHNPYYPFPYLESPTGTYPPIFPLLLAPLYKYFGLNLWVMKIEMVVFFLGSLFLIYRYFESELPKPYAVVLIAVVGLNPYFWEFKECIMSDLPFLFFVFLTLNLIKSARQDAYPSKGRVVFYAILVGICLYLAYGTRSVGIILFLSFLIANILRWRKPTWFMVLVGLVFLSAAILQNLFVHHDVSYIANYKRPPFHMIPYMIKLNLKLLSRLWENGYEHKFYQVLSLAINTLAFFGWGSKIKRSLTMAELFPVLYGAFLVIWQTNAGIRYWVPIIPFYIFYLFVGVERIGFYVGKRWKTIGFVILLVSIFASYFGHFTKLYHHYSNDTAVIDRESEQLFAYVRTETETDTICLFLKPNALSFFTERKAAGYHPNQGEQGLWCFFREIKASYLIVSAYDFSAFGDFLERFVRKYQANFKETYSSKNYKIYKIVSWPSGICDSP